MFDFELLKVIANDSLYPLSDLTKIYYVRADGQLASTETNAFYKDNGKTDLQQLVTNNPSYLLKSTSDMTTNTTNSDGLILSVDGKSIVAYNDTSLFCIYPQKAFIMGQKLWRDFFVETPITLGEWGWLSQKDQTVYDEIKALKDKFWPEQKWFKLSVMRASSLKVSSDASLSVIKYNVTYNTYSIEMPNSVFYKGSTFYADTNVYQTRTIDLAQSKVRGLSPDLLTNDTVRKAKTITSNVILLLYEYINRLYFTP